MSTTGTATGTGSGDARAIARSLVDPHAFTEIFDRHFDFVHRYLARRVGRQRADDLAAQTFTVAFELRRRYRPRHESARPWLLGIATNLVRNDRRAEQRRLESLARLRASLPSAPSECPPEPDGELAAALAALDPGQRDALLLYAWGELPYEEIAAALAIPVGTVRSRLSRARAQLREALQTPERTRR